MPRFVLIRLDSRLVIAYKVIAAGLKQSQNLPCTCTGKSNVQYMYMYKHLSDAFCCSQSPRPSPRRRYAVVKSTCGASVLKACRTEPPPSSVVCWLLVQLSLDAIYIRPCVTRSVLQQRYTNPSHPGRVVVRRHIATAQSIHKQQEAC